MNQPIRKLLLLVLITHSLSLSAQPLQIAPSHCDTLTFDSLKISQLTYVWDGEFEDYELIDTLRNSHIVEVLYGDNYVRMRHFSRDIRTLSSSIRYMKDGDLLNFTFGAYYKGTLWYFTGDEYSLMCQAYPEGQKSLIAEFSKCTWRKKEPRMRLLKYWKLTYRHGKPVNYARKLLKIYKAQYKDVFYHLDNCIWY